MGGGSFFWRCAFGWIVYFVLIARTLGDRCRRQFRSPLVLLCPLLCACRPSSARNPLCLFLLGKRSRPHSVSDHRTQWIQSYTECTKYGYSLMSCTLIRQAWRAVDRTLVMFVSLLLILIIWIVLCLLLRRCRNIFKHGSAGNRRTIISRLFLRASKHHVSTSK